MTQTVDPTDEARRLLQELESNGQGLFSSSSSSASSSSSRPANISSSEHRPAPGFRHSAQQTFHRLRQNASRHLPEWAHVVPRYRRLVGIVWAAVFALLAYRIFIGRPTLSIGSLPGDISYSTGSTHFYFPVVTCIVLSVIFSALGNFFR